MGPIEDDQMSDYTCEISENTEFHRRLDAPEIILSRSGDGLYGDDAVLGAPREQGNLAISEVGQRVVV